LPSRHFGCNQLLPAVARLFGVVLMINPIWIKRFFLVLGLILCGTMASAFGFGDVLKGEMPAGVDIWGWFRNVAAIFGVHHAPEHILLLGTDSNGGKAKRYSGTRSDTIMFVTVDRDANRASIISVPRDSRLNIPGHGLDKINSAHAFGGPELTSIALQDAFGVKVDHYFVLDTIALKKLCELVGPMDIVVEKEMHYHDRAGGLYIDLKPGRQRLSPVQVEEYVRFRHDGNADIGRIQRQQWFLRQLATKLKQPEYWIKIPQVIQIGYSSVRTDLSLGEILDLANFARGLNQNQIITAACPGYSETTGGASYWMVDSDSARRLFSQLTGSLVNSNLAFLGKPSRTVEIRSSSKADPTYGQLSEALKLHAYPYVSVSPPRSALQHAQIEVLNSNFDAAHVEQLRSDVPIVSSWPVTYNVSSKSSADVALVIPASALKRR
jgi:LCP family protein required for cell wall assembly